MRVLIVVLAAVVVGIAAALAVRLAGQSSGSAPTKLGPASAAPPKAAQQLIGEKPGAPGMGSSRPPATRPAFGAQPSSRSALSRTSVQPGSKAWRFDKQDYRDTTALTLYLRIASRGVDAATVPDVVRFADVMLRCREFDRSMRIAARTSAVAEPREVDPELERLCKDSPSDAATKSDEWLTAAAELEDLAARYMFANMEHLSWVGRPAEVYRNPQRLIDYKPKALAILNDLASQGHIDSLMKLSMVHMSRIYGDDPALSWAYAQAAMRASGNHAALHGLQKQLSMLSPADQTRAQRSSEEIYAICCR